MISRRLFIKYLSAIPLIGVLGFPKPEYYRETVGCSRLITAEKIGDDLYGAISSRYAKALSRAMTHSKQMRRIVDG